jgi:hypothetical protein
MTHVSLPYINTGRITVLYNRILVNRWVCLDFSIGNNAQYALLALHILLWTEGDQRWTILLRHSVSPETWSHNNPAQDAILLEFWLLKPVARNLLHFSVCSVILSGAQRCRKVGGEIHTLPKTVQHSFSHSASVFPNQGSQERCFHCYEEAFVFIIALMREYNNDAPFNCWVTGESWYVTIYIYIYVCRKYSRSLHKIFLTVI